MKKVAVIMGSDSDFPIVKNALAELKKYIIICAAGMAAHLAGVIAGNTTLPVIGIPIKSTFEGLDALLATVQMPSGIPVATVAVNGAKNAAILAIEMLALSDDTLAEKLEKAKQEMVEGVEAKDKALQEQIAQL